MFDALAKGFKQAKNRLAGLTELTEQNVESALREVRLSLLEADVELGVVKAFLARVKEKALGEVVRIAREGPGRAGPEGLGGRLVHRRSATTSSSPSWPPRATPSLVFAPKGQPTGIMMVGLQGSGKTTTCAKLARYLQKQRQKPLLVAADMQRPAAVEQLQVLGEQIDVPVFNVPGRVAARDLRRRPTREAKKPRLRRHHLRHRRPPRDRREL